MTHNGQMINVESIKHRITQKQWLSLETLKQLIYIYFHNS